MTEAGAYPTDRLGRPLYVIIDEDEEPVLYRPSRWPAIDIDRFGQSRAFGYEINHPELLLDGALSLVECIDEDIRYLKETLAEGRDHHTGRNLNPRRREALQKTIRDKRISLESLIADVHNTMGQLAGDEFERRAREITGDGPYLTDDYEPQGEEHRHAITTDTQLPLFS